MRDPKFVGEFQDDRTLIADLPDYVPDRRHAALLHLMSDGFVRRHPNASTAIMLSPYAPARGLAPRARALGRRLLARLPLSVWFALERRLVRHSAYTDVFRRYPPDVVGIATSGLIFAEMPLLAAAQRRGVPVITTGLTWDNLTVKLSPIRPVSRVAVWNEVMKREAIARHGYRPDQVVVTGAPQFDVYARRDWAISRDEYCRRIGADPRRKLVLLATNSSRMFRHHPDLVDILARAIADRRLSAPAHLLVRLHPLDDLGEYRASLGHPHVTIEKPYRVTTEDEALGVDVTEEARDHLANTLLHSDVVVNISSTIAIEACLLDRPVVNVAFDGYADEPYQRSARRFVDFTHFRPLVETGGVRVARTAEELLAHVDDYLADPEKDRDRRRQVALTHGGPLDGRAGERIAAATLELAR